MATWSEVLVEIQDLINQSKPDALDIVRRKYLAEVHKETSRNVIAYYSGWLHNPNSTSTLVNDRDKLGFMQSINGLDRSKGLDLILHTPGGDIAATESLVDYIQAMFGYDVRVIVPQISMSAGTMIALSSNEILMGKQSNLGPIDPQMGGLACQAILNEFESAVESVTNNPSSAPIWQTIISKYHPTLLGACEQAIEWSEKMVAKWLELNMCKQTPEKVPDIIKAFSDHKEQKSHARHISKQECIDLGLNITSLENSQSLQNAVLTTHHAYMHTFSNSRSVKIIENHNGVAYIENGN